MDDGVSARIRRSRCEGSGGCALARQRAAGDRARSSRGEAWHARTVPASVAGRVSPRYGYEGGGMHPKRAGALLAGDLSGAKARLLQMVALGGTATPSEARTVIESIIGR